jgi:hypothetical protein
MDLRKSQERMRRSDATMDRVLAKSRKLLKQKKGYKSNTMMTMTRDVNMVPVQVATTSVASEQQYLSPKKSREPDMAFVSSLHPNSYGYVRWLTVSMLLYKGD